MSEKKKTKEKSAQSKAVLEKQSISKENSGTTKTLEFGGLLVVSNPSTWLDVPTSGDLSHPTQPPWIHFT